MEIWRDIAGFEGHYQVSNQGRVKSLARKVFRKGSLKNPQGGWLTIGERILKPLRYKSPRSGFYHKVFLWRDHEYRQESVHTLVCEAFHGVRPSGYYCCHRDDNGLNNREDNLYWGTPTENYDDMRRNGRNICGSKTPWSKLTENDVVKIRAMAGSMTQREIGEKFGVGQPRISRILSGEQWRHVA